MKIDEFSRWVRERQEDVEDALERWVPEESPAGLGAGAGGGTTGSGVSAGTGADGLRITSIKVCVAPAFVSLMISSVLRLNFVREARMCEMIVASGTSASSTGVPWTGISRLPNSAARSTSHAQRSDLTAAGERMKTTVSAPRISGPSRASQSSAAAMS